MADPKGAIQGLGKAADLHSFGLRLADRRAAKGWKQRELARRAGIDPSRISRLERGISAPRVDELARLRAVLGGTLDEMLFGESLGEVGRSLESLGWTQEEVESLDKLLRVLARRTYGREQNSAREGLL